MEKVVERKVVRTCAVAVVAVGQLHMGLSRTGEGGKLRRRRRRRTRGESTAGVSALLASVRSPAVPPQRCALVRIAKTFGRFATCFITFATSSWCHKLNIENIKRS